VKREDSLNALVGYDSADCEGFANSAALARYYGAGEYLRALLVAFFDFTAYVDRVAYFEMRYIFLKAFAFNSIEQLCFHVVFSLVQSLTSKRGILTAFGLKARTFLGIGVF
jgi:hypothetical protein